MKRKLFFAIVAACTLYCSAQITPIEKYEIAPGDYELTFASRFDHIVVNDILEDAENEALCLINEFLKK